MKIYATEKDIGKLCKFWDEFENVYKIGKLEFVKFNNIFPYNKKNGNEYMKCKVVRSTQNT